MIPAPSCLYSPVLREPNVLNVDQRRYLLKDAVDKVAAAERRTIASVFVLLDIKMNKAAKERTNHHQQEMNDLSQQDLRYVRLREKACFQPRRG